MDFSYIQIILGLLSALILFLYAIENLSREIQVLASEKFHKVIGKLVKNRYVGTIFGALTTALMQSSSAVTVMTVILVNTGIISFHNSLGVIFGSNIGTTITAQLVLVNSTVLASVLIIVGFLLGLIGKKIKTLSKPIFFLGFILFSLSLLSSTIEPLKSSPELMEFFSHLSVPIVAFLVSAVFTGIIHSSSITSGIIVILAQSGLITIDIAIPMILGANLGSSITALLASIKLNLYAKRVGFSNFLFNAIGTTIFMFLIPPFVSVVTQLSDNVAIQAAIAHLLFNTINTLIFLILLNPFERLITFLIKGNEEEILFKTKYVNKRGKKNVSKRIVDIKKEIAYSIENAIKIYQKSLSLFYNNKELTLMEIKKLETLNDFLDDEITQSIVSLSKFKLSPKNARKTVTLIKVSNTIEQIGDLGDDFSKVFLRMHNLGINPKEVNIERLTDIHNRLIDLFRDIEENILDTTEKQLLDIKVKEEEIYAMIREEFDIHVLKLQEDSKYTGSIFVDAISIIELSVSKVRDIRKLLLRQVREFPS